MFEAVPAAGPPSPTIGTASKPCDFRAVPPVNQILIRRVNKMKKILSLALSLAMAVSMLAGCGGGGDNGSQGGSSANPGTTSGSSSSTTGPKEIRVALEADIAALDPRNASSTVTAGMMSHIFSKLVSSDASMKPAPDLAESWEQLDELTWQFHLRKDVTFHDGSPFTAEDVVFTLDSIASDNTWKLYSDFSFLKATVVDDYTVNITTEEPYPGILLRLNYVHIIPKAYTEQVGNEAFAKAPIGTGPYKFAEWSKDEHVILEAYDGYFGGKPSIDKITFNIIPEVASRIAALEAGEVMFSAGIPSVEMERLNALDTINVVAHPASRVTYLSFNHLVDSPIQNLKVRQAICHAVDFDKLINGVLDGYASPLASMACPEYDGYDAAIKGFDYNPELSKQLLAEAGYPDGFAVQASYSQSSADGSDVMQFIAAQLGEVGIKVELLEQDSAQQREMIGAGTVAPLYLNALGGPYANIDLLTKLAFCTGERYSTYTNPEFDALRQKASVTVDQTERDALNSQIQQFILDDAAALILYQPSTIYAYNTKLLNWEPRADEMKLFFNCDLA